MEFSLQNFMFLGSIPLIIALVQVSKGWITNAKYYPIIAMTLGVVFNVVIGVKLGAGLLESIVMGLIAGLTACGAYSADTTP